MPIQLCSNLQYNERKYNHAELACMNCVNYTTDSKKFFNTQCPRTVKGELLCETPNANRFLVRAIPKKDKVKSSRNC